MLSSRALRTWGAQVAPSAQVGAGYSKTNGEQKACCFGMRKNCACVFPRNCMLVEWLIFALFGETIFLLLVNGSYSKCCPQTWRRFVIGVSCKKKSLLAAVTTKGFNTTAVSQYIAYQVIPPWLLFAANESALSILAKHGKCLQQHCKEGRMWPLRCMDWCSHDQEAVEQAWKPGKYEVLKRHRVGGFFATTPYNKPSTNINSTILHTAWNSDRLY